MKARVDDGCSECFVDWCRGRAAGPPQRVVFYVHISTSLFLAWTLLCEPDWQLRPAYPYFLSAGIQDVYHHTWQDSLCLRFIFVWNVPEISVSFLCRGYTSPPFIVQL